MVENYDGDHPRPLLNQEGRKNAQIFPHLAKGGIGPSLSFGYRPERNYLDMIGLKKE